MEVPVPRGDKSLIEGLVIDVPAAGEQVIPAGYYVEHVADVNRVTGNEVELLADGP